ncbi:MAG: potassium-transporting ATPase subunit KdpC [Aggregatilineales bacterium]
MIKNAILVSILMLAVLTIVTGVVYPLAITAIGVVAFPSQAAGSLVTRSDGSAIGSSLIAQNFTGDIYFWPRPSAVNYGVNPDGNLTASGASNLGPTSAKLLAQIQANAAAIIAANHLPPDMPISSIPSDLLFASASGLDPHISPAAAQLQIPRVAAARGVSSDKVAAIVSQYTEGPQFGIFGQPRVNVLLVNVALDKAGYFLDF